MRRRLGAPALAALALLVGCGGATATPERELGSGLRLVQFATGLDSPVHLTFAAGERRRLYVVEQAGVIKLLVRGKLRAEPFLDIRSLVASGGERGLLSVAFHPDYATNRRFYVNYTNREGDTEVVEYRSDGVRGLPASRRPILLVEQPYANHNGGQVAFGPDGKLYVGMGDGGSQGDPQNRAQNLSELLGKLLRIDVDQPSPAPEIVAYGLRNPWRFSFDRATGDLWIADVGGSAWEEIDVLEQGASGLVNFGWDVYEGDETYEEKAPNPAAPLEFPLTTYAHGDEHCSITGGFVYRGPVVAARGRYFYGDYCSGAVWSLVRDAGGRASDLRREQFTVEGLSSFGENSLGGLFLVSHEGTVFRLAAG